MSRDNGWTPTSGFNDQKTLNYHCRCSHKEKRVARKHGNKNFLLATMRVIRFSSFLIDSPHEFLLRRPHQKVLSIKLNVRRKISQPQSNFHKRRIWSKRISLLLGPNFSNVEMRSDFIIYSLNLFLYFPMPSLLNASHAMSK